MIKCHVGRTAECRTWLDQSRRDQTRKPSIPPYIDLVNVSLGRCGWLGLLSFGMTVSVACLPETWDPRNSRCASPPLFQDRPGGWSFSRPSWLARKRLFDPRYRCRRFFGSESFSEAGHASVSNNSAPPCRSSQRNR